jgi:hypothetical protein
MVSLSNHEPAIDRRLPPMTSSRASYRRRFFLQKCLFLLLAKKWYTHAEYSTKRLVQKQERGAYE